MRLASLLIPVLRSRLLLEINPGTAIDIRQQWSAQHRTRKRPRLLKAR